MKACCSRPFVARLLSVASLLIAANLAAADRAPLAKLELADGDCLVFLGDSITHQCLYTQYVEDFLYTRFPSRRFRIHNAGVGGAQAWDALQRFEQDVAKYKPKYVTVLLGMNDGRYRPYDDSVFQTYRDDMTKVIARIRDCGATPILMTPTMFDARADRAREQKRDPATTQLYNSVLAYYGGWLRDVAVENGFGFVDMYSPLNNLTLAERKQAPSFTMIRDAIHPGPAGQLVMAAAILNDLQLAGPLSHIRIDLTLDQPLVRSDGGDLTELTVSKGQVEFSWLAEGLPFVVPAEAADGARLLRMGSRMSRERLAVFGLPPESRYELLVNGTRVGRYAAAALARGVDLQNNKRTPQYQQALQVAELNKQRNAGPVRQLRGEWRQFQQYARARRRAEANSSDEAAQQQFAELETRIAGMADRVAKHEAAAKSLEDEIFASNAPEKLAFTIRALDQDAAPPAAVGSALPRPSGDSDIIGDGRLELLFQRDDGIEGGLTEGPAVAPDGSIYFSDITRDREPGKIMRFDPQSGQTTVFASDSGKSNGLIFDAAGRLVACEGADFGGRRISRWDTDNKQRVTLVDRIDGKRLNAPNDLCLDDQGRIYFTDPRYIGDETRELEFRAVYRIDTNGEVSEATREVSKPNGIAISPDGSTLYVADHDNGTDRIDETAPPPPQGDMKIYAFQIDRASGALYDRRILFDFGSRKGCDGMTVDAAGNLYLTARDPARPGILVLDPQGREVAFVPTGPASQKPEAPIGLPSNVEFGIGAEITTLYVTVDTGLYRIPLAARGFHRQHAGAGR